MNGPGFTPDVYNNLKIVQFKSDGKYWLNVFVNGQLGIEKDMLSDLPVTLTDTKLYASRVLKGYEFTNMMFQNLIFYEINH